MRKFGLIGYPLTHSFSQTYFNEKFRRENISDCRYDLYPITSVGKMPALIQAQRELVGLNVTIPYKEQVIPFLNKLDFYAEEIGAVNVIRIVDGKRIGYNTDVFGFMHSIKNLLQPFHSAALILGTGGSSKAVAFGLKKMGIEYDFVSRNPDEKELRYADLDAEVMHQYKIIINTTPVGMFPKVDDCPPIPYELITRSHLLFDLIYNPDETLFLKRGRERGATVKNGLEMLQLQAEKSWEIWNS